MEVLNINLVNNTSVSKKASASITLPVGMSTESDVRVSRFRIGKGCVPILTIDPSDNHTRKFTGAGQAWLAANQLIPTGLIFMTFDAVCYAKSQGDTQAFTFNPYCTTGITSYLFGGMDKTTIVAINSRTSPREGSWATMKLKDTKSTHKAYAEGVRVHEIYAKGVPLFDASGYIINTPFQVYDLNELCINPVRPEYSGVNSRVFWEIGLSFSENTFKLHTAAKPSLQNNIGMRASAIPTLVISRKLAEILHPGTCELPTASAWESGYSCLQDANYLTEAINRDVNDIWDSIPQMCLLPIRPTDMSESSRMILSGTAPTAANYSGSYDGGCLHCLWADYDIRIDIDRLMPVQSILITSPDLPIKPQRLIVNNTQSEGSINPSYLPILKSLYLGVNSDETSDIVVYDDSLTTMPVKCAKSILYSFTVVIQYLLKDNSLCDAQVPPGESFSLQITFTP